ncbi:ComEA family DNA-binding protein [Neisseria weaveri]|uniref:ComE1 n=1 Tax=Neisseria weaveri TaxID=28091 RepID=A0A181CIZ3_9NEIS|nr:helix-hairpin-helix domain-containing protein [Neisseria weaveri]SAY51553.1 ComE1 [Neisseria weaveri]SAY51749.1 ComE1 [Neisseria weaveri]SAY51800.1 ComE1 [Neisseria weaveri]SAY52059.1 ComE1 [Neisseria weaveri]VEJ50710.1 ComE1 [Neisseria weaveri]
MKRYLLGLAGVLLSALSLAAVNINTATAEELKALPGIGPAKAEAIVAYRSANGPFKAVEDLKKVKGIGEGVYGRLKDEATVAGVKKKEAKPLAKKDGSKKP